MTLAVINEVPEDKDDWLYWSFAHAAHHIDCVRVIYQTKGVVLAQYLLDPMNLDNMDLWLYQHQVMHLQMDAVLNIQSNDLLELDWEDPGQLQEWITFNFNEHYQAATILGVG